MEAKGDNFPLGIVDRVEYVETLMPLKTGDKVVFFTEGIVEALNEKVDGFGIH
jgi:serine phosphatase RsbU (regulator of sigma subunit)